MRKKSYLIKCLKCNGESRIIIKEDMYVDYKDNLPIISSRLRRDLKWGFECICGNDTRMCEQEFNEAPMLLKGSSGDVITRVIDNMRSSKDDSFIMQEIK